MTDIIKTCQKHGPLTIDQVSVGTYKNKTYRRCKQCMRIKMKKFRENNLEVMKERNRKYWKKKKAEITKRRQTPEKLAKRREWAKTKKDNYADYYREKQKKYKEELADPYIKKCIQNGNKNIIMNQIPQSMIELQRAIMKSKKRMKELSIINTQEVKDVKDR